MTPINLILPRWGWTDWAQVAVVVAALALLLYPLGWVPRLASLVLIGSVIRGLIRQFRPCRIRLGAAGDVAIQLRPSEPFRPAMLEAWSCRLGSLLLIDLELPGEGSRRLLLVPGQAPSDSRSAVRAWLATVSPGMVAQRTP